jgi:hypothetical protein
MRALTDAARRGTQVAVLVEITARFDEVPNMAWGQLLESEGVHVSYGVQKLKTHVKLAIVVREEAGRLRTYVPLGTGNYHTGTARAYEDLGVLTCDPDLAHDVASLFNQLADQGLGGWPMDGRQELERVPPWTARRSPASKRRAAPRRTAGPPLPDPWAPRLRRAAGARAAAPARTPGYDRGPTLRRVGHRARAGSCAGGCGARPGAAAPAPGRSSARDPSRARVPRRAHPAWRPARSGSVRAERRAPLVL